LPYAKIENGEGLVSDNPMFIYVGEYKSVGLRWSDDLDRLRRLALKNGRS
jgi:hypothetical protein